MHGQTDARTDGCTDKRMHGQMMHGQTDARTDGCTDRRMHGQTDARTGGCTDRRMHGQADARTDGCTDRRMHGQTDARTDGCTDRRMHGPTVHTGKRKRDRIRIQRDLEFHHRHPGSFTCPEYSSDTRDRHLMYTCDGQSLENRVVAQGHTATSVVAGTRTRYPEFSSSRL